MELLSLAAPLLYAVVSSMLGWRMLRANGWRGAAPARLLSTALFSAALAQVLAIPILLAKVGLEPLPLAWKPVFFGYFGSCAIAATCIMRFTQIVYHPSRRAVVLVPIAVGGYLGLVSLLVPFLDGGPMRSPLGLSIYPIFICSYGWTATESFRCWLRYRRAPDLDPVVVDRFRMWGLFAALVVLWVATNFVARENVALGAFSTLIGVASSGALWIAFRPPAFYRRWLGVPA